MRCSFSNTRPAHATPIHAIEIKSFSDPSELFVVGPLLPPLKTNHRGHKEHRERRIGRPARANPTNAIEITFFSEPSELFVVRLLLPPLKTNHRGHKEHKERRIGGWGRLSTVRAARGLNIAPTRLSSNFIRPNPGAPRVGFFPAAAFLTDHINSRATYSTRGTSVARLPPSRGGPNHVHHAMQLQ